MPTLAEEIKSYGQFEDIENPFPNSAPLTKEGLSIQDEAKALLTSTPPDEDETALTPVTKTYLTLTELEDSEVNIDRAVRTLREVASDTNARASDRITAAKVLLEASGALNKGTNINVIKSENTQINQNENSEENKHLMKALGNLSQVLSATDAGVRIHKGGQGF